MKVVLLVLLLCLTTCRHSDSLSMPSPSRATGSRLESDVSAMMQSRRSVLGAAIGSLLLPIVISSSSAGAEQETTGMAAAGAASATSAVQLAEAQAARDNLLTAIQNGKSDENVMAAIEKLVPFNPLSATSAKISSLDGEWRLLWSVNDNFSPLLRLPKPFKPNSFQYFGPVATSEVGEGRVAQGLTGGLLGGNQLWLSSGIEPLSSKATSDYSNPPFRLEIEPPFRFELGGRKGTNEPKKLIVEAGNDADFRKVNARSKEAQLSGKNIYEQIYVETKGKGSLRISTITEGDPAIVGTILIHEKM